MRQPTLTWTVVTPCIKLTPNHWEARSPQGGHAGPDMGFQPFAWAALVNNTFV
jgi:hypothetical protein